MIKYKLICKNCNYIFDSWFASSNEFEKLKKIKLLNCNNCGSLKIEKSVMSPRVSAKIKSKNTIHSKKFYETKIKIKEFQKFIKSNFEDVGDNFSYEARSIHYGGKKSKKGIYGSATRNEIKELQEEGIETAQIPWFDDKDN